jgi:hypothetical protein
MPAHRRLFIASAIVSALFAGSPSLHGFDRASDLNRTTVVRFATDVLLPGTRLTAGTYVFMLADPLHAREVVTITSRERRDFVLMMFTRIVNRPGSLKAGDAVSFGEEVDGTPIVAAWWPIGDATGREFVYGK